MVDIVTWDPLRDAYARLEPDTILKTVLGTVSRELNPDMITMRVEAAHLGSYIHNYAVRVIAGLSLVSTSSPLFISCL